MRRLAAIFTAYFAENIEFAANRPHNLRKEIGRVMATYIHQLLPWPRFRWSDEEIAKELSEVRHRQGLLLAR